MNKNELVTQVAQSAKITKADAQRVLTAFMGHIQKSLAKGEEVRLIGFGTFSVNSRKATTGRNPRTGQEIKIPATKLPKFRAGKQLKDAVAKK